MTSDPNDLDPTADPDDDLDGVRTPMARLAGRGGRWLAALVAAALILPGGMWLVDEIRFRLAGAAVVETLAGEVSGRAIADTVLLVSVTGCDAGTRGSGSAFVVELPDGPALLTNRHVVDRTVSVGVRTLDGSTSLPITNVRVSDLADVAVLEVADPADLPPALVVAPVPAESGAAVRLIGFPAATPFTTEGTVAGVSPQALLLDLDVDPGASGSPVVDDRGHVVGQVFAVTEDGFGVATPSGAVVAAAAQTHPLDPC